MLLPSRKAAQALGLHPNTLRKYANAGLIKHIRTPTGQRLYDVDSFRGERGAPESVAYIRVSSRGQRDDLESQRQYVASKYPSAEIIEDIGSGLNFKRKGLRALLERAVSGDRLRLVVAHRDRLARFGHELVEWVIRKTGGELVVLDQALRSAEDELTQDLLHILHVFSCRMYGRRKYRVGEGETNPALSYYATESLIAELVRRFQKDVQSDRGISEAAGDGRELHGDQEMADP
jgi:putative resolvase